MASEGDSRGEYKKNRSFSLTDSKSEGGSFDVPDIEITEIITEQYTSVPTSPTTTSTDGYSEGKKRKYLSNSLPRKSAPSLSVVPSPSKPPLPRSDPTRIDSPSKNRSNSPKSRQTLSLDRHNAYNSRRLLQVYSSSTPSDELPETPEDEGGDYYDRHLSHSPPLIKVHINLSQYKLGLPHKPCSLDALGIIPNRYLPTSKGNLFSLTRRSLKASKKSHPVIIRGIVPSSSAALTEQLQPGDEIVSINGQSVTIKSIEEILATISNEIIFEIYRGYSSLPPGHALSPPPTYNLSDSPSFSSPSRSRSPVPPPPLVLFLTLDTKEDDPPDKDILYRSPSEGEFIVLDQLVQLRGVFLTLGDLTPSFSNSSYTSTRLVVDSEVFHVSGHLVGKEVLLAAVSDESTSGVQVERLLSTLVEVLLLLFGDLKSAFCDDITLPTILHSILSLSTSSPCFFLSPTIQQLPLSVKTAAQLSGQLNQLDSISYRNGSLSLISPLGSCLFYKSCLVSHHLSPSLLRAVYLICYSFSLSNDYLLPEQTTVWKRIHLKGEGEEEERNEKFVLIMGIEHTLLCQVLLVSKDINISLFPDDRVRENGRKTLEDIHSSGLLTDCERRMVAGLPSLTSADVLLASRLTSSAVSAKGGGHMTRSSTGSIYSLSTVFSGSLSDSEEETSHTISRRNKSVFHSFRLSLRKKKNKSAPASTSNSYHSLPLTSREPYLVTAGLENHLLYYVCLESGRGLMVTPSNDQISNQPVHRLLLETFQETASSIHTILHQKRIDDYYTNEYWEDEKEEKEAVKPFDIRGSPVIEHGVLVSCTTLTHKTLGSLINPPSLQYWIIGRLFEDRELYICYQENMSQTCVEMAFKLLFGSNVF